MKKELIRRCVVGALAGVTICQIISIWISLAINDGTYYAVVPELRKLCSTETTAVLVQTICAFAYGAVWGGVSLVWELENWSLLKQTIVHFLISSIATFPIAYSMYWMQHSVGGVLSFFGIFAGIYVGIWLSKYFSLRNHVDKWNEKLKSM